MSYDTDTFANWGFHEDRDCNAEDWSTDLDKSYDYLFQYDIQKAYEKYCFENNTGDPDVKFDSYYAYEMLYDQITGNKEFNKDAVCLAMAMLGEEIKYEHGYILEDDVQISSVKQMKQREAFLWRNNNPKKLDVADKLWKI